MKTVLVTGGAGYIGSLTVRYLNDLGYKTVIIDDLSQSARHLVDPRSVFYHASILEYDTLKKIFSTHDIDVVYHLAAKANVPESVAIPNVYYEVNVEGTRLLLSAMSVYGVKKIIFSSSGAVFGNVHLSKYDETAQTGATSPYGDSKIQAEELLRASASIDPDFRCLILRYFNVAGADLSRQHGQVFENGRLVSRMCIAALQKKPMVVHCGHSQLHDGSAIRDYIHVSDVAAINLRAIEWVDGGNFELLHVGTGVGYSVLEMTEIFQKANGVPLLVLKRESRKGDASVSIACNCKINKLMGPQFSYLSSTKICSSSYAWSTLQSDFLPTEIVSENRQ